MVLMHHSDLWLKSIADQFLSSSLISVRLKEGGNSTVNPLGKKQPDYVYGYHQQQHAQEDWGSLKQDYESGGL